MNVDSFDFSSNTEASYQVKIEGRLLDNSDDPNVISHNDNTERIDSSISNENGEKMDHDQSAVDDKQDTSSSPNKYRLSHFLKSISIDFDRTRFRNGTDQSVEWKKPESASKNQSLSGASASAAADFDELTFKRNGDENVNITINLHRHEVPERYQLSPELAEVVDLTEATQQEAVTAFWEYIRFWNLQEDEEKRNFRCDELLRKVCDIQTVL